MNRDLILASASTARARLLRGMGIPFRVVVSGVDEIDLPGEAPDAKAARLARLKAEAVAARLRTGVILGADSLVALLPDRAGQDAPPPRVLGKPADKAEAVEMLRLQMGRVTEVITAVCIIDAVKGRMQEGVDRSRVILKAMTDNEIDRYASDPKVRTSAGGYLLENENDPYVSLVSGELGTVLGLPVSMTKTLLAGIGWPSGPAT